MPLNPLKTEFKVSICLQYLIVGIFLSVLGGCGLHKKKDKGNPEVFFEQVTPEFAKRGSDMPLAEAMSSGLQPVKPVRKKKHKNPIVSCVEAKESEIPVPCGAKPLPDYYKTTPTQIILGYSCAMSREVIAELYNREMERLGWKKVSVFEGQELMLIFSKPHRICVVSVRSVGKKTAKNTIIIFLQK